MWKCKGEKAKRLFGHKLFKYVQSHIPVNARSDSMEKWPQRAKALDKDTKTMSYLFQYAKCKGRKKC